MTAMKTAIGDLNERVRIERNRSGPDDPADNWSHVMTVWAKRRDASASESYRAQEVGAEITARFTIRWSVEARTVTPLDRIVHEGRVYAITGAREVKRRCWIEIDAVARAERSLSP